MKYRKVDSIKLVKNQAKGLDLSVDRDVDNPILILTGKAEYSLEFWRRMKETSELAIEVLNEQEQMEKIVTDILS